MSKSKTKGGIQVSEAGAGETVWTQVATVAVNRGRVPGMTGWSSTLPPVPGRYWWRAPDPYGREENRQYGLLLLKWITYSGLDTGPDLRIVSFSSFNGVFGGEISSDGGGWSYSGGSTRDEFRALYKGVEFWPEPERGPDGFLPTLPDKPDWTPRDPKIIEAERKASEDAAAKRAKEETDERAEKIAEAKSAGEPLYECAQCEELYAKDDLVQVRECPHCDERFNGTDEGQNCPSCNRRFTRNITEHGCPECLDDEYEVFAESVPDGYTAETWAAVEKGVAAGSHLSPEPQKKKRRKR